MRDREPNPPFEPGPRPAACSGGALCRALHEGDLEAAARWAERRGEELRALDPDDPAAVARAREIDREVRAVADARSRLLREELETIAQLRGRLSKRRRPRRGARFIDKRV